MGIKVLRQQSIHERATIKAMCFKTRQTYYYTNSSFNSIWKLVLQATFEAMDISPINKLDKQSERLSYVI